MFISHKMSTAHTQHYSLDSGIGATKLVLDNWKSQAMIIDNDVMPESKECPVIPGFENTANTLSKSGAHFTTVPLNPMSRDVNFLYQNYITIKSHLKFSIACGSKVATSLVNSGKLCIYVPSTCMLPSRIMLLSGNSIIWSNQYQRQEAIVTMCSLPQGVVSKSCDYTTLSKLINNENFPGFTLPLDATIGANGNKEVEVDLNLNIDINQLSPILSNIVFTTPDMGNLRLRLFFENLEEAFSWSYVSYKGMASTSLTSNSDTNATDPFTAQIVERIPLNESYKIAIGDQGTPDNSAINISLTDWSFVGDGLSITQSCFGVREESKIEMKKYIAQDNKLIIPTQCWNCVLSNNTISKQQTNASITFNLSAYNVNTIAFLFPTIQDKLIFHNPIFKTFNCKYNSKSLNYVPYGEFDKRMIKDTIQALINDDYYAVNENLFDSIAPSVLNAKFTSVAGGNLTKSYYSMAVPVTTDATYPRNTQFLKYPNLFTVAFNVSPVNTFEKGFSVASSNQGVIQVRVDYNLETETLVRNIYSNTDGYTLLNDMDKKFPASKEVQALCLCLCDCCLVLDYNPVVGSAQTGSVVFAEPFIV